MYIRFVKKYLKPYVCHIFLLEILVLGQVVTKAIVPLIFSTMIDTILPAQNVKVLCKSVSVLMMLYIVDAFLGFGQSYLLAVIQGKIGMTLRKEIYDKVGKWQYSNFDKIGLEEILDRYGKGIELIRKNIAYLITNFFKNICTFLVGSIVIFLINPYICFVSIIVSVIYLKCNLYFGKKIKDIAIINIENNTKALGCINENYKSAFLTRGFNAMEYLMEKFDCIYKKQYDSEIKLSLFKAMNIYSGFLILILITIFIWLLGGYNVVAGRITVGEIVALINYQGMVANPMNSFSVFFNSIEEAKTSINRIMEYIDYENEQSGEMKLESISTIEFSKVYFSYRNREKVLSDINFTVNRGEKILLVGRSGSGKSTIGKLFLGLYKQESGCIYINNRPLHCYSISDVREKITFISQESIFFNDTILKNIDLQEKSKFEDIIYYCSILDIKDEICEMPLQFNTVIDGNGGNLSGGQKKRLEIVRGILKNSDVYIFDETVSSLDEKRRTLFYNIIETLRNQGKIIILITHYVEQNQQFDKIINLDKELNL